MHDAHFHISDEIIKYSISGICNVSSIEEYEKVRNTSYYMSAGIHPWYVDTTDYDTFFPILEKTKIIGEIGLDNTWCSTDLNLQKEIFERQLKYASIHKKPVILHLKGMEKEAYSILKKYPNTYLVHWHSTKEYIQEYIDLNCYFTIGPSIGIDEAVNEVCRLCPMDRMLIESDGIDAITWAFDKKMEYISCLNRSMEQIATIKNKSIQQIENQLDQNFKQFIQLSGY